VTKKKQDGKQGPCKDLFIFLQTPHLQAQSLPAGWTVTVIIILLSAPLAKTAPSSNQMSKFSN